MPDGTVLVAGGSANAQFVPVAETFDPASNTFMPLKAGAAVERSHHTATLLTDGRVLVAGLALGHAATARGGRGHDGDRRSTGTMVFLRTDAGIPLARIETHEVGHIRDNLAVLEERKPLAEELERRTYPN